MKRAGRVAWETREKETEFFSESMRERVHFVDLRVDGRILKLILKKQGVSL
jgi:hypothetical protein